MKSLNSIIIEGTVCDEPDINNQEMSVQFNIQSRDIIKTSDGISELQYQFPVKVFGRQGFSIAKGKEVRVVGSLKTREDESGQNIFIQAEHTEVHHKEVKQKVIC